MKKTNKSPPYIPYYAYIQSLSWKSKANERKKLSHYQCDICGSKKSLQIHHKTYKRLGRERMSDLACLCSKCHKRVHMMLNMIKFIKKNAIWIIIICIIITLSIK